LGYINFGFLGDSFVKELITRYNDIQEILYCNIFYVTKFNPFFSIINIFLPRKMKFFIQLKKWFNIYTKVKHFSYNGYIIYNQVH